MPDTDGQLYIRFINENYEEGLRILYEEYSKGLTLFINGFVNSIEDAEDLISDLSQAFEKAFA